MARTQARLRLLALLLAALVLAAGPALAAGHVKLVLKNGEKIEGELLEHPRDGFRVRPEGGGEVREVCDDAILRVDYGDEGLFWLAIGLCGNAVFGSRFLVQWIASERAGKSTVPVSFWYLSIAGSLIFLAYALHIWAAYGWKTATPLVISYAPNTIPYIRNLMLVKKEQRSRGQEGAPGGPRPVGAGSPQDVEAARR